DIDGFGMPSPTFADFDGDGDLDLICGEFLDGFTYYENMGTRTKPAYAPGRRLGVRMDLQMITPVGIDWDGDGDTDLICGDEDGRVALIENTGKLDKGVPLFLAPVYFKQQAAEVKFGALASPFGVDWDGDGDDDLISGNTAGYVGVIENLGPGASGTPKWAAPRLLDVDGTPIRVMAGPNGSIQGPAEAKWGYTTLSVADWDGDKLPDLIVNGIWGKPVWYRNTGTRAAPKLAPAQPIEVEWPAGPAPRPAWNWWSPSGKELATQWRTTPFAIDWNKDGLTDLVMLDHEGYLALFPRERRDGGLVLLPGKRIFTDATGAPLKLSGGDAGKSGRRKFCLTDWDRDGKVDLLINAVNVSFYRNVSESVDKVVFKDMGLVDTRILAGHDTSPTVVDWDKDGVPDLVVGGEDGYFYTMPNPHAPGRAPQAGVRAAEYIYENGPVPECHASTIVDTPTGLVAAWFGGIKEGTDDVSIWVSRHMDGKWTAGAAVATGVEGDKRFPCWNPVLFQPAGQPLALYYKVGPSPSKWWGMRMTSIDGGKIWTKPERLPDGVLGPIKNKPVQLADGTLISPVSTEHAGWRVHFERSTDGGKTWRIVGPIPTDDGVQGGAIQPTILVQKDGSLRALCRAQRAGVILETTSRDAGQTWAPLRATTLPNPNSGIDAVTLKDGRHLLVYNHTPKGRSPLNLAISTDGGTWQPVYTLESEPGEYSYPAIVQAADGRVHIAYTWKRQRVKHVLLDPAQLPGPATPE
ncbi:MAG: exo-alpha-sialidase, partial [Phycisphaerae bacterium]